MGGLLFVGYSPCRTRTRTRTRTERTHRTPLFVRSFRSFCSFRSQRSPRSRRSFRSFCSFCSRRSPRSPRSFRSRRSPRSPRSRRSFRSLRSPRSRWSVLNGLVGWVPSARLRSPLKSIEVPMTIARPSGKHSPHHLALTLAISVCQSTTRQRHPSLISTTVLATCGASTIYQYNTIVKLLTIVYTAPIYILLYIDLYIVY